MIWYIYKLNDNKLMYIDKEKYDVKKNIKY